MDKFDVMEVNEKQRERIDLLLTEAGHLISIIRHKEKIIKTQQEYISDLESQIQNMQHQIDQQTDWRNYVQ